MDSLESKKHGTDKQEIAIVDIRIPFVSLLIFMLKLTAAAIPAFIIFYMFTTYFLWFGRYGFGSS